MLQLVIWACYATPMVEVVQVSLVSRTISHKMEKVTNELKEAGQSMVSSYNLIDYVYVAVSENV